MKVVLLTQAFGSKSLVGGVERHSMLLRQIFPDLQAIDLKTAEKEFFIAKIPLPEFNEIKNAFFVQKTLMKNLSQLKPEMIFTQGLFGFALTKKKTNAKIINFCHGTYAALAENGMKKGSFQQWKTRKVFAGYEKKSIENASIAIANSEFTRQNMKKYYGLESNVIYNPIDLANWPLIEKEKARKRLGLQLDKKIVLFVGRPDYSKGFDLFLETAKRMPEIFFVAVTFPKAEIKQKNLLCLDPILWNELNAYYNAADAVLFPSRFEGFGFVTIEALALNKPVIALNTGIAFELKNKIENLFVCNKANPEKLAEATLQALGQKEKESRKKMKELFSISGFKKNLLKAIK